MTRGNLLLRLVFFLGRLFYRLRIEGVENIPIEGSCVLAFNHAAPLVDGLTGLVIFQRRPDCVGFGGRGLAFSGRLGRQINDRVLGAYKARGLSAGELLKALAFLRAGRPIALAAEGELTWDGRLQYPLAPGAAWMALRGHVPVVVVVSKGGYDIMPRWARFPKLNGRVTIRVSQPFYVSDAPATRVTDEMVAAASQRIYDEMAALMVR